MEAAARGVGAWRCGFVLRRSSGLVARASTLDLAGECSLFGEFEEPETEVASTLGFSTSK
ncbi:hypothetical protein A0H81_04518 [Grifola frondosa]|uniref:Uncharacterized protein n=1 Tax=Grifola frondosa TaxID=5627 RepID=A0A1C7MFR5_GRIFR|nr:hypothetical protein A0H81_04518 [Grifola frondosa]